jgi:hypothetical protein
MKCTNAKMGVEYLEGGSLDPFERTIWDWNGETEEYHGTP